MRFTLNYTPAALPPFNRLAMRASPKRPTLLREGGWVQRNRVPLADHVQSQLMEGELKEGSKIVSVSIVYIKM